MQQIATFRMTDAGSGDEATVIVRATSGLVAVAFSLLRNGDVELVFTREKCQELLSAIEQALAVAG